MNKASDGYVYLEIKNKMYRLKQAAIIAYDNLVKTLQPYGYKSIPNTM